MINRIIIKKEKKQDYNFNLVKIKKKFKYLNFN